MRRLPVMIGTALLLGTLGVAAFTLSRPGHSTDAAPPETPAQPAAALVPAQQVAPNTITRGVRYEIRIVEDNPCP